MAKREQQYLCYRCGEVMIKCESYWHYCYHCALILEEGYMESPERLKHYNHSEPDRRPFGVIRDAKTN